VPSPNVAEDHQTKNAMALVEKEAALWIPDHEAVEKLVPEVLNLLNDPDKQEKLANSVKKLAKPDAATEIAKRVMNLIDK
jgi:UDP-N-acetylglucosamine--N-acetylmuramyl-(pentapeptide) pyrophosphoryl-undecaprenol N-acetylglucosamine transferase